MVITQDKKSLSTDHGDQEIWNELAHSGQEKAETKSTSRKRGQLVGHVVN